MGKLSESKKKANIKWNKANLDRIQLVVRKGNKDIIKECADKVGESVNSYIVNAVKKRIHDENGIDL